jgi:CheY-like chemotaxis protein/two-component sensor histidine kinase
MQEAVQTVQRNGKYLLELVNNILDLSRIESGKIEIEKTRFTPTDVIENIVSLMKMRAREKDLYLRAESTPVVPESIETDATRLQQVLLNLVGNALKFTNQGGVTLEWGCYAMEGETFRPIDTPRVVEEDPVYLIFHVRDTGIGIPEDRLGRVFEPFVQADISTTRRFGGSGLGLSICRKLVQMLGGTIEATSRENVGSTFTIRWKLPAGCRLRHHRETIVPKDAKHREENASDEAPSLMLSGRVLLVEDGPDNQRLIAYLLKKTGVEVSVAENGKVGIEAVETAKNEGKPFELILMDMQMPVLDGYEATRKLRENGDSTPVIALTAHAMSGDAKKCLAAGCDGFLAKPFKKKELQEVVAQTIGDAKANAPATG